MCVRSNPKIPLTIFNPIFRHDSVLLASDFDDFCQLLAAEPHPRRIRLSKHESTHQVDKPVKNKDKRFNYEVPVVFMIQKAMMQLPGQEGTTTAICETMIANPDYEPLLNWSPDPSRTDAHYWVKDVSKELSRKTQVRFPFTNNQQARQLIS